MSFTRSLVSSMIAVYEVMFCKPPWWFQVSIKTELVFSSPTGRYISFCVTVQDIQAGDTTSCKQAWSKLTDILCVKKVYSFLDVNVFKQIEIISKF